MRSQRVRHDWATKQQQQSLSGLIQELEPSGLSGVRWGSKAAGTQMLEAGDGEEPSRPIVGQWKSCHTRHHISKMALLECNSTCLDSFTFTISYSACATCLSSELFRHSPWKKNYDKARKSTKKQRHHLLTKVHIAKAMVFPSSCVWMWELDHKEGWVPKNWCFQTVVLKKTLESPLGCREIKPVNPEYSLKGLILKLKFQYFGHLMQRTDALENTLMLGKVKGEVEGGGRGKDD